jgi:anti-sigma factor RsiW
MTCTDAQRLVNRLLDGEISDPDAATVFTHLSACPECRRFYRESVRIQSALRAIASDIATPIGRPAPSAIRTSRPAWVSHVAVAAAAVALVLIGVISTLAVTRFNPRPSDPAATRVLWVFPEREITPSSTHSNWR